MAVFIFGAGATRGCSFVDSRRHPCLPPLDGDFFTQLQRVQNRKHEPLIRDVMADVVELFGSNFTVTMETVFATLEHTMRMLATTGETRDFRREDLAEKSNRLRQAIAVVLEDSLTKKNESGGSQQEPQECEHHTRFVEEILKPDDEMISFNYDCVLDHALKTRGTRKWNAEFGYAPQSARPPLRITGFEAWQPDEPAPGESTARFYKLHGSLHFQVGEREGRYTIHLKQRPYTWRRGDLRFDIIPPESQKAYDKGVFADLWRAGAAAIHRAGHIVVVGYSLPATDLHSTALLRTSVKKGKLCTLIVVNPDREARKRVRSVLQRGLSRRTRVLSFDYLPDFLGSARSAWES